MLGRKSKNKLNGTKDAGIANRINAGSYIEGIITSETNFRIDGKIKGQLICKEKVVIGNSGEFIGEIESKTAVIQGKMTGKISVEGLLHLTSTAIIEGEINYNKLLVEEDAVLIGSLISSATKSAKLNEETKTLNSSSINEQTA